MNKRGIELQAIGWILIGLAILVIVVVGIAVLQGKGSSYIDYIRQLFTFGR